PIGSLRLFFLLLINHFCSYASTPPPPISFSAGTSSISGTAPTWYFDRNLGLFHSRFCPSTNSAQAPDTTPASLQDRNPSHQYNGGEPRQRMQAGWEPLFE